MGGRLRRLVALVRLVAFPASIALVAVMAVRAADDVDFDGLEWWLMAPAAGATLVWWLLLARAWSLLHSGRTRRDDVRTWCRTQALRYLPGGIWAPVSRAVAVDGPATDRLATVAAENVLALCAALTIAGVALGAGDHPVWLALVAVAAAPAVLAPLVQRRSRVDGRRARLALGNNLAGFTAYALAAVLVQAAVSGWHDPLAVAGAAALAWGAGLVVPFTPGGIGVREIVYVWLLERHGLPHGELVAAAVAARLITVVVELGVLVALGPGARRVGGTDLLSASTGTVETERAHDALQSGVEVQLADRGSRR